MPIFAKNIIVGAEKKEEPKVLPASSTNSFDNLRSKIVRTIPFQEKVEEKTHYEIVKDGDLIKHHNTKSHYLNDMTGFGN